MNNTFFATIAVQLVVFLGVLLTLRENQRRFETNLWEEREKARKEREFLAKHKALLSAAESVTRFINYYMTLPDRELPKDGTTPDDVAEMGVTLNNLHFYCDIETIQHSIDMSQILSTSFTKALKAKMPSMFIADDIKIIDLQIVGLETMNSQFQQEILALLSSDSSKPLLISNRQQLVTNFKKIAELHGRKVTLIKAKYHATEACRDVIRKDLKEIYGALGNVLLMARRELAFPIDESQYATMLNRATELALANMESLFDEIRAQIAQKLQ
ncbi:MAG: hypothetical protein P9X22_00415 [Candidatus Zapsychrus exili]|nr:hypothetical protein [Candidatus Zapsychrus exili]